MPGLEALSGFARELLAEQRVGHLGVIDGHGRPRVLPVTFAAWDGAVWSAVDDKPKDAARGELARVRWLRERPQATLCVDRYRDRWEELAWVQLVGRVELLEPAAAPDAVAALAGRYVQYREHPPGGPLLRLAVDHVAQWQARAAPRRG